MFLSTSLGPRLILIFNFSKTSAEPHFEETDLFPCLATRYHSLIIERKSIGKDLVITAQTKDSTIMGVMHKKFPVHGVQFHPESIKTPMGLKILKNFINYK